MLVMEVDEEDWDLGYDAVDGGSTASVAAILDGKTLVYAAVGDSCSLFGVPAATRGGEPTTVELIPEHSPTNVDEWAERLHKSGIHVVYDHPEMFESEDNLLNVFEADPTGKGKWRLSETSIKRADAAGCALETEHPLQPLAAPCSPSPPLTTTPHRPSLSPQVRLQDGARRSRRHAGHARERPFQPDDARCDALARRLLPPGKQVASTRSK